MDVSNANAPLYRKSSTGEVFAHRVLADNAAGAATLRPVATGPVGAVTILTSVAAATRADYAQSEVAIGDIVFVGTADEKLIYTAMLTTLTSAVTTSGTHFFINCG